MTKTKKERFYIKRDIDYEDEYDYDNNPKSGWNSLEFRKLKDIKKDDLAKGYKAPLTASLAYFKKMKTQGYDVKHIKYLNGCVVLYKNKNKKNKLTSEKK